MKSEFFASSIVGFMRDAIVSLAVVFLVSGCESLGIRDILAPDQIPADVKAEPILVATPAPAYVDQSGKPRLGDVPFMPNSFSPKPVYDHYMNELEYDRAEAVTVEKKMQQDDPALPAPPATGPQNNLLIPPQLPGGAQ